MCIEHTGVTLGAAVRASQMAASDRRYRLPSRSWNGRSWYQTCHRLAGADRRMKVEIGAFAATLIDG
jgi:hypothetical protein